jgi:hypothetical protein
VGVIDSWKPNPKQELFLSIPYSVKERFYGGAAAGGKTEVGLKFPVVKKFYEHPRFCGIVFRRTYKQLDEGLIPRADPIYRGALGASYNDQKRLFKFPSGARIYFTYLESDDDARKQDTNEYHYMFFEELTEFTQFQYEYVVLSRNRTTIPELPAVACSASNPGNIGHQWVRETFVDPCPTGKKIIELEAVRFGRRVRRRMIFIPASVYDNPHILEVNPTYIDDLSMLPEAEAKAKLLGDWFSFYGQVFTEFRPTRYEGEPENALHVIEPFSVPDWWPKVLAIDWGYAAMTWAGLAAIAPDGRVFIIDEYAALKTPIKVWGADVARMVQRHGNVVAAVIDTSATAKRGEEMTLKEQFIEASGIDYVEDAERDRLSGKSLLHDMLRWKPRPPRYVPKEGFQQEVADRVFRMLGPEGLEQYEKAFRPEEPEGPIPRLQIFNTCTEVIKAVQLCVYDEGSHKKKEDVKPFIGDDPYDGVRYLLKRVDRYVEESRKEGEKRDELWRIIQQGQSSRDLTDYYRRMSEYEARHRGPVPIPRRRSFAAAQRGYGRVS